LYIPGNSTGKTVTIWWHSRRPTDTPLSEYSCPKCTECNYFRWTFRSQSNALHYMFTWWDARHFLDCHKTLGTESHGRWCCSELNHYLRASGVWANPNPLSICKISMCWWKIHDQPSKNWWFNPYFGVSPTGSTRINERPLHSRKTPPRMTSRAAIKSRGATLSARLKGSVVVIKGSNPTV